MANVQAGFLAGIPATMVGDIAPSLKALDDAVMKHPKVRFRSTVVAAVRACAVATTELSKKYGNRIIYNQFDFLMLSEQLKYNQNACLFVDPS